MKSAKLFLVIGLSVLLAACASTSGPVNPKWQVSEAAQKLIDEQGEVTAAMIGYDDDSQLVCEEFKRAGSHMKERFCYTRKEYEKMHLNHQETYRKLTQGTPRGGN